MIHGRFKLKTTSKFGENLSFDPASNLIDRHLEQAKSKFEHRTDENQYGYLKLVNNVVRQCFRSTINMMLMDS